MRKKILIVDDEQHLLRQYSTCLKDVGEIQEAKNSKEALSKINKYNFNLLVLDCMLTGDPTFPQETAGLSILKNVREKKIDTPAILLILIPEISDPVTDVCESLVCKSLGMPINLDELIDKAKELMFEKPPNERKKEKEPMKQLLRSEIGIKLGEDMPPITMQEVLTELSSQYGIDLLIEVIKDIESISPPVQINTDEILPYLNFIAYQNRKNDLEKKYPGGFVAFLDGREVGHNPSREDLIGEVYKKYKRTDVFITEIKKRLRTIKIRHPRRVLR